MSFFTIVGKKTNSLTMIVCDAHVNLGEDHEGAAFPRRYSSKSSGDDIIVCSEKKKKRMARIPLSYRGGTLIELT